MPVSFIPAGRAGTSIDLARRPVPGHGDEPSDFRAGSGRRQLRLFEEYRYSFYITNDREMMAEEIVFSAKDRCDQET